MDYFSCAAIEEFRIDLSASYGADRKPINMCCEDIYPRPSIAYEETPEKTINSLIKMRNDFISNNIKAGASKTGISQWGCAGCARFHN